jgi:hypothetical protein
MNKKEIKQGIKSIIDAIKISVDNIEEYSQSYIDIKEHLDAIQQIEEENSVETGIDYETVLNDTLRSCIRESGDIQDIENQFDYLLADLDNWQSEVSDKKSEQIQELYIDILAEIKDSFEIDSIECVEDLQSQLDDMIDGLNDIII